ncbi:MAG: hypothetical protein ABWW70_03255 [Thermoproteota archaeon]
MQSRQSAGGSWAAKYAYSSLRLVSVRWRSRTSVLAVYEALGERLELGPAQFVQFWVPGLEAVPLTPLQLPGKQLAFLVKARGPTTEHIVRDTPLRAGAIGPLGRPFHVPGKSILLVGGGVGVASVASIAQHSSPKQRVVLLYGARTAEELAPLEELLPPYVRLVVSTDDGSRGIKGTVAEALLRSELLDPARYDAVVAAGPPAMLCKLVELANAAGFIDKLYLSLEQVVKCGMGFCGSCRIPCGPLLLCIDGPVLPAASIECWRSALC